MISIASSIRFRKEDGLLPSFDNTLNEDEIIQGGRLIDYFHKVYTTDKRTIQAKLLDGQLMNMQYSANCYGAWQSMSGESKVTDGTVYDYWECEIDFSVYSCSTIRFRMVVTKDESTVETWISEPVEILTKSDYDGLKLIEFFNIDNAFEVDYSTDIVHQLRIDCQLRDWKPAGEQSVFDNQDEVTKISGEVKRQLILRTEPIPAYLAEMLTVACAHDKFFVNEVEFTSESNPEWDGNMSTLGIFTVTLTQRNVIGLNTHDIGFNCDSSTSSDMIHLQEIAASGQKSFTITDDYMVLTITGRRTAGSPSIKAGITPGGSDILADMSLTASYLTEVALIPTDKASITGGTLYVTISGAGATATIDILTVKNRP